MWSLGPKALEEPYALAVVALLSNAGTSCRWTLRAAD